MAVDAWVHDEETLMGHRTPVPTSRRASPAYVRDMEQREREARIYEESIVREAIIAAEHAKIYEENLVREAIIAAEHSHELVVYETVSGAPIDDHDTEYGICKTCDARVIRVVWADGQIEDSLMTFEQEQRFDRLLNRIRMADNQ